jgi:hypothetical protein
MHDVERNSLASKLSCTRGIHVAATTTITLIKGKGKGEIKGNPWNRT